jgi:polysaccharide export outer membrane protein
MMRKIVATTLVAAATGCGVVYTSPTIREISEGSEDASRVGYAVKVIPLTAATVVEANATSAAGRGLPDFFYPERATPSPVSVAPNLGGPLPRPATAESAGGDVATRLPPPAPPSAYRIGAGDAIAVTTRAPEAAATGGVLRSVLVVQDDGTIATGQVGTISVGGRTIDEAQRAIFEAFVASGLDPSVSAEVVEFNSQAVVVGGAVAAPSLVTIGLQPLFLDQAVQRAGGIAPEDLDAAVVRLIRDGQSFQAPARDVVAGAAGNNVALLDGDRVIVDVAVTEARAQRAFTESLQVREAILTERTAAGTALREEARLQNDRLAEAREAFTDRLEIQGEPRDFVYLSGEFTRPTRVPLPFVGAMSLSDALYFDLGIPLATADMSEVYVVRGPRPGPEGGATVDAYHLDASNAANLALATRFALQPSDVVFVAEQPITRWNRILSQLLPGGAVQTVSIAVE